MQRAALPGAKLWQLLTVVVATSPVPSNPDTSTLKAVFASFKTVPDMAHCRKIMQFDGAQEQLAARRKLAYDEFKRRTRAMTLTEASFSNTLVSESHKFLFSAHNLRMAIRQVNTSFVFVMQHDYVLAKPFDAYGLLRTMHNSSIVKHVRLNMRPNAPARGFDGAIANYTGPSLVPLTKTCGWSDAPHIASTRYYVRFCIRLNAHDHNGGARKFMEESIHYNMQRNGHPGGCWALKQAIARGEARPRWPADFADYGTFLYGYALPSDGSYTVHRSLRGKQGQWGIELPARGNGKSKSAGKKAAGKRTGGKKLGGAKHRLDAPRGVAMSPRHVVNASRAARSPRGSFSVRHRRGGGGAARRGQQPPTQPIA